MGIRYKLLTLLLLISLAPLLVVGVSVKRDLVRLGDELAARSSGALLRKASDGLQRIVEDHARVLRREKQLLESSTQFLASRIEGILYGHEHAAAGTKFTPSAAQVLAAKEDYYFLHLHGRQNLDVDFDVLDEKGLSAAIPPDSFRSMLLPLLKEIKFKYPELVLWIDIRLQDSTKITYPKSIADIFVRDALYEQAAPDHARELSWSLPQIDMRTRMLVFNVTVPIKDAGGKIQGDITLVVPVSSLFHRNLHLNIFSDNATSLLVIPETDPATVDVRLRVIAREEAQKPLRDHWTRPEKDTWLIADDTGKYALMLDSLRAAVPGVVDMPLAGKDFLWAFAPVEKGRASLVILVPKTDVVKEALSAKEFILGAIGSHNARMRSIVLGVALIVLALAFVLSKLFTRNISKLATAVGLVAHGDFTARADIRDRDEIGRLGEAFNRMVPELKERISIKNALEVAQQVQQNLLPSGSPQFHGNDIAATSEYCYETGGDYFDFIPRPGPHGESLVVAVGDVSDHGIPSALMMASARAYIRSHAATCERLDDVVKRVNELIADDSHQTGRFMTLFLLELTADGSVRWVRAGHDPALMYDPAADTFHELAGDGFPLGIIRETAYELNERPALPPGQIIVIGTDGIWETIAPDGGMFGKKRLREIIRAHRDESSTAIIQAVVQALNTFRGPAARTDDMTVAVVKTPSGSSGTFMPAEASRE